MGILQRHVLVNIAVISMVALVRGHPAQQVNRGNAVAFLSHGLKTSRMSARVACGMLKQGKGPWYQQALLGKIAQQLLDRLGTKGIGWIEQDQIKGAARNTAARGARQHIAGNDAPTRAVATQRLDILIDQSGGIAIDLERDERASAAREHLDSQGTGAAKGIQHADLVQIEIECRHDHGRTCLAHAVGRGTGDIAPTRLFDLAAAPFTADDSHPPLTSLKICR